MAENPQQQIDHYDYINAPQFVDFDELAAHDDPDADRFFETHREEDDFMIPLDINSISPTVQLLYDEQFYSNEANKAAQAAGLEDVKIEYYASPQNTSVKSQPTSSTKKSITSVYGTPLGASGLSSGNGNSFYTPTGGEDKENVTPLTASKKGSIKKADGKIEGNESVEGKPQRVILSEKSVEASICTPSSSYASPQTIKKTNNQTPTQSLYSQLEKLHIVSSSDDEDVDLKFSECTAQQPQTCENVMEELARDHEMQPELSCATLTSDKLASLDLSDSKSKEDDDAIGVSVDPNVTIIVQSSETLAPAEQMQPENKLQNFDSDSDEESGSISPMEPGSPVNNILKQLDAEFRLVDENESVSSEGSDSEKEEDQLPSIEHRNTPMKNILKQFDAAFFLEDENANSEDPRCSIVVAPSVGHQVHWNSESIPHCLNVMVPTMNSGAGLDSEEEFDENSIHDPLHELDIPVSSRRASSVGNLPMAVELEPKERMFRTFGYNPRVGITIPKTPEVPVSSGSRIRDNQDAAPEKFASSKNACYFEIDPPPKSKNLRRVSSCSDLHKLQEARSALDYRRAHKTPVVQKRALTLPKTPDTMKRSQKHCAASNASSATSTCSNSGTMLRGRALTKAGPNVAERLAAARSRVPMKGNHYVSMAEAMIKYQKNTPDRFRTLPRGRIVPERRAASSDARKRTGPTPPRSPDSSTATRSRTSSFADKEKSVKAGSSSSSGINLPKRVELKTTVPKPFNFGSSHRPRTAPVQKEADAVDFKFKARPAPKPKMDHTIVVKPKPQLKVTQPMSPHFASDDRLKERHQKKTQPTATSPKTKQGKLPVPKPSRIPAAASSRSNHSVHVDEHKTTVVQPFSSSFEARQKEILRRKEEKIKQELEEDKKSREFHANPVPKFKRPIKKSVEVPHTHVEPFHLKSDERGAAYKEALEKKLAEEARIQKEMATFHAQPADVIHRPPFEPEKPSRIIEGPLEIHLATEKRAAEREQFDEQIREKEREEEERRREEQEKLEEMQRQEDLERRRQIVHKAQPFKEPKPFQLKSSAKPLTVPHSPAFSALPSERRIKSPPPQ